MAAPRVASAALSAALCACALSLQAAATTIHVPADEPTIQAGIDAASVGDTVLVAPGTYVGPGNRGIDFGGGDVLVVAPEARSADLKRAQSLLQGFLEGTPDGHGFPHGFHGGSQRGIAPREFLEIEAGNLDGPEMVSLLKKHTKPMIAANVDYVVLGCSHYPYIIPQLKAILPDNVTIIDSGEAVARQTKTVLQSMDMLRDENTAPKLQFFTNAETDTLKFLLKNYSEKISVEKKEF